MFVDRLAYGQMGESRIATWLRQRGNCVLPVYEVEVQTRKGPRLFAPDKKIIVPDMFVFKFGSAYWVEAKHKNAFSWHRKTNQWVTGIDLDHYLDYCDISRYSIWPVWLLFLHDGGQAKDSPPNSPCGLFGNSLEYLKSHENHRFVNYGKGGMVYWAIDSLIRMDK